MLHLAHVARVGADDEDQAVRAERPARVDAAQETLLWRWHV